jgi:hypothetical protein
MSRKTFKGEIKMKKQIHVTNDYTFNVHAKGCEVYHYISGEHLGRCSKKVGEHWAELRRRPENVYGKIWVTKK